MKVILQVRQPDGSFLTRQSACMGDYWSLVDNHPEEYNLEGIVNGSGWPTRVHAAFLAVTQGVTVQLRHPDTRELVDAYHPNWRSKWIGWWWEMFQRKWNCFAPPSFRRRMYHVYWHLDRYLFADDDLQTNSSADSPPGPPGRGP